MIYREQAPLQTVQPAETVSGTRIKPLYRGTQIVWYVLGVIEALLAFRFILRAMGANPAAGFTSFIYGITSLFVAPFLAVFRSFRASSSTIEWSTLLAMLVYWLLAWAIIKIFVMSKPVSTIEANDELNKN